VLVAAPLVESVTEPAMSSGGLLASTVGRVLGVGPGRGVALVIVVVGLIVVALGVVVSRDRLANEVDDLAIERMRAAVDRADDEADLGCHTV